METASEVRSTALYKRPTSVICELLEAATDHVRLISPDGAWVLEAKRELHPPIRWLARPRLRLAGLVVDRAYSGLQRLSRHVGLKLVSVATGEVIPLRLPSVDAIDLPVWSHDSRRFAFTAVTDNRLALWVGDTAGRARQVDTVAINDVLAEAVRYHDGIWVNEELPAGPSLVWVGDNRSLLARTVPSDRGEPPTPSEFPIGPHVDETVRGSEGRPAEQTAPWTGVLANDADEALFRYYARSQLVEVDIETGKVRPVGAPALITQVSPSPSGRYLLVTRLQAPLSHRVTCQLFPRVIEVWDRSGSIVSEIASSVEVDHLPPDGVPMGPRAVQWQPRHASTLIWVEALDGGDPRVAVEHRDRIMRLREPLNGDADEVCRLVSRCTRTAWMDRAEQLMVTETDRHRQWRTVCLVDLGSGDRRALFDLSTNDAYANPGKPVLQEKESGEITVVQDGNWVYFSREGASKDGSRPSLDRFNLVTGRTETVFQSDDHVHETFVAFTRATEATREQATPLSGIIVAHESPVDPPNLAFIDLLSRGRRFVTHQKNLTLALTPVRKELVRYRRADGVELSGTLHLPAAWTPDDGPLPLVIEVYPHEYSDPATASQIRVSSKRYLRPGRDLDDRSPLWFVTQGYAVLEDAAMPVVGDGHSVNDTYIEQIVASAKAAIDALDQQNIIDPHRVVVTGHSYGAFAVANLVAHSDLFAAAIARSGSYNRILTPFGFQREVRSLWEAPEFYHHVSPYEHASQIRTPTLLIHGLDDPLTALQTQMMFLALRRSEAPARMVLLPHEGHRYAARESILHVIAEMLDWANRWTQSPNVDGSPVSATTRA